ncbi:MAG: hypothetical protein ACOX2G_09845 [Bacillota bacterium]|jgi:aminopeptidase N
MTWLAAKWYSRFSKKFTYTVQNYELELTIDPRRYTYSATASITMTVTKNTNQFYFLLSDQCALHSVTYLGLALPHTVKQLYPGLNLIKATLPRKADEGEKLVMAFIYRSKFSVPPGEAMELAPGMNWYPFSPLPQAYTCKLNVVAPESFRIVGVGKLSKEQPTDTRMLSQWKATIPFRGLHMLAGDFLKTSRDTQPQLDVYYPRKFMNQGKFAADNCEKLLAYFTAILGPAPTPSIAVVLTDNSQPGINTSLYLTSIYAGSLEQLREYDSAKERNMRMFLLTAREMARRWLKESLALAHPSQVWYLDGLAEYLSWLALEEEYGPSVREQVMLEARELVLAEAKKPIATEAFGVKEEFAPWLVAKAAWLMRAAHCLAGEAFLPSLQEYYAQASQSQYAPSPAEFFRIMGSTTRTDMDQLYREWVQDNSELRIVISEGRTFQDDEGNWQLLFNLENQGKLKWPHPVEIKLDLADGNSETRNLYIEKDPHLIRTAAKIVTVTVDPELKFLNWAQEKIYTM